jgi:hypothetical protein
MNPATALRNLISAVYNLLSALKFHLQIDILGCPLVFFIIIERFNLKKLNEVECKEQYQVEISDRFAALENLDDDVDINSAWETVRENIKISGKESLGYELKKDKPLSDKGCSELLDQRKQAKLQWLQDPSQISGDNINSIRHEASQHFRNKKKGISERQN